jgi:excisionase family DNA binding protein
MIDSAAMPRTDAHRGSAGLKSGYLYLMQIAGNPLYKIGVSQRPMERLRNLRRNGWHGAQLLGAFHFARVYDEERRWHRYFKARRRLLYGASDGQTECFELGELSAFYFLLYNNIQTMARTDAMRGCAELTKTMNKKEVAELLNISTRLVERYASEGRLGEVTYVRGKTGKQAEYARAEVERLKAELETVDRALPANSADAGLVGPLATRQGERLLDLLSSIDNRLATQADNFSDLKEGHPLFELMKEFGHRRPQLSDLAHKLMLSLDEAAQLAGLSRGHLRAAITEGKLKGRIIGRGFKVKRADLDAYVKKL